MKNNFTLSVLRTVATSGFFTMLFLGNTFAQQGLIADKQPLPTLAKIELNSLKNPQPMANGCDTVNYAKGFTAPTQWTAYNWTAITPNSGLVHGTNSLGDKEKGNYLDLTSFTTATHITGTFVWFTKAYSTNPAKIVTVKVYDNSGAGGSPGTLLGSQNLAMSVIMANDAAGYLTRVVFSTPIVIPGSKKVFVTCDYSALTWTNAPGTDSLSIVASDTLEENPGIIWEKTSANLWHPLDDGATWEFNKAALFILPFVTDNITVPTATLTPTPANATICAGSSITLNPTGSVAPYGDGWWATPGYTSATFSGPNLVLTYTVANTYTAGYETYGCGTMGSAQVTVTVNPKPTLAASSNAPICAGTLLQLSAATNGTSYLWTGPGSFSSTLQNPAIATASVSNSGTYVATVTNAFSCTNTQNINVVVNPCTGIDQIDHEGGITIVQNENQQFFLLTDTKNESIRISIYNMCGSMMSSVTVSGTERVELKTFSLISGMYFVQVNSSDKNVTKKIIIAR